VSEEDLRKQRIAIQIMRDVLDETFQAIGSLQFEA
jgi:hypothetical protein